MQADLPAKAFRRKLENVVRHLAPGFLQDKDLVGKPSIQTKLDTSDYDIASREMTILREAAPQLQWR